MDSNITLRSNIYINRTRRRDDREFLKHVTDNRILKKLKNDPSVFGYSGDDWLTAAQRDILNQGDPQCYLETGTRSWGVPIGGDRLHCRCEQRNCAHYTRCAQYWNFDEITRAPANETDVAAQEQTLELHLYTEEIESGTTTPLTEIQERDVLLTSTDQLEETVNPAAAVPLPSDDSPAMDSPVCQKIVPETTPKTDEVRIVDQAYVIEAPMSARIWVNAGPGTGKTYTVIQRICHLLNSESEGSILVLCFSRNAVQEIRNRLIEVLGRQVDELLENGDLVIRTYDSFATYMLEDELNTAWDYNRRIEEFIKMLRRNPGTLGEMIGYLIVDEMQDTVGSRARMVLAMLDELTCGALLLGDRCQAIFDWTVREADDMTFDVFAEQLAEKRFQLCELRGNHRQAEALAEKSAQLRQEMLSGDEKAQEKAVEAFKTWARSKWRDYTLKALPEILSGGDLILTKTNGEAARISQSLFENALQLNHVLKQSASHRTLAPWIALTMRDSDGHFISKNQFMQNAERHAVTDPEEKWEALKALDGHPHAPTLHISETWKALAQKEGIPELCLNRYENCAVVSTVHRAKGSEAERVYWLESPLLYDAEHAEEGALKDALRAAYVAATRAKSGIHLLAPDKKFYMKSTSEGRWIRVGISKSGNQYCSGIAFSPEDTDSASFADPENGMDTQELLSTIEPGMPVTLYPKMEIGRFEIYFDGIRIGTTSVGFTDALFRGFAETNRTRNWPIAIPDVFISSVVTVIKPDCPDVASPYRQSGCWLGIELGGFPNLEWY